MKKLHVKVLREHGEYAFKVTYDSGMTVLDILEIIYRDHDSTLAYRFFCRTSLCTTCIIIINGCPELCCMEPVTIENDGLLCLQYRKVKQ